MHIHKEQFSAGEIAKALRLDPNILQNWLRRSNLEPAPTVGGRRLFSTEAALQLAILKELNHYGMGPVQAGDLIPRLMTRFPLESLTGDEVILFRPWGGNSTEDLERADYSLGCGRNGMKVDLKENQSGLILAVGTIAKNLLTALEGIVRQRGGVSAV